MFKTKHRDAGEAKELAASQHQQKHQQQLRRQHLQTETSDQIEPTAKRAHRDQAGETPPAPPAKRLNFSIESIMQQSDQPTPSALTGAGASLMLASLASQHAQACYQGPAAAGEGAAGSPASLAGSSRASSALNSRSPSPGGDATSATGQPGSARSRQEPQPLGRRRTGDTASVSGCSQVSSRETSPISPGANNDDAHATNNHDQDDGMEDDVDDDDDDLDEDANGGYIGHSPSSEFELAKSAGACASASPKQAGACSTSAKSSSTAAPATKRNGAQGGSWSRERQGGSTNALLRPQVCREPKLAPFQCQLDNLELWHRFHPLDTEMIITKQGR